MPPAVAALASLGLALVSLVVVIGGLRTFVDSETERLPREHFTTEIPWTAVNIFVGSIVFGIAVAIGFLLLILPGLFLLVSLVFWQVVVAVENEHFVEGFRRSWALTRGRRLRLFGLGVVVVLIALAVSIVFAVPGALLPPMAGLLVQQVGSALVGVFFVAIIADTDTRILADDAVADPTE